MKACTIIISVVAAIVMFLSVANDSWLAFLLAAISFSSSMKRLTRYL